MRIVQSKRRRRRKISFHFEVITTEPLEVSLFFDEFSANLRRIFLESSLTTIRMLLRHPVFFCALIDGYDTALTYLYLESYSFIFSDHYGFNVGVTNSMLWFIQLGRVIGFALWPLQDRHFRKKNKEAGEIVPEARLNWTVPGILLLPLGDTRFSHSNISFLPIASSFGYFIGFSETRTLC